MAKYMKKMSISNREYPGLTPGHQGNKGFLGGKHRLLLAVVLAVFALVLLRSNGARLLPAGVDFFLGVIPASANTHHLLHKGFLPLWDATTGCGRPQTAELDPAFFYPPWFLAAASGGGLWWSYIFIHVVWAFLGFYLWLRSQKASQIYSLFGALSFAGSAHMVRCWTCPHGLLSTAAWIPWIFWAVERTLEKPLPGLWLMTSVCLTLQLLAGYPFFVFYTWVLLGVWLAYRRPSPFHWGTLAKAAALAGLVAALQWLPFLESLGYTFRQPWDIYPYITRPKEYLTLLFPTWAGDPLTDSYQGSVANGYYYGNLYFGLIPFVLFIAGWGLSRPFQNRFWGWGALCWGAWLTGLFMPALGLNPLPFLKIFDPSKSVGLFLFCACTWVALNFSAWEGSGKLSGNRKLLRCLLFSIWVLDIVTLPSRILHWVPDPYSRSDLDRKWRTLSSQAEGYRVLSLQRSQEPQNQPSEVWSQALEALTANSNTFWDIRSVFNYTSTPTKTLYNIAQYLKGGPPYNGDILDIAGVRFFQISSTNPLDKENLEMNLNAAPRGWWVREKALYLDRPQALGIIAGRGSAWRNRVLLDQDGNGSIASLRPTSRTLLKTPERVSDSRISFNFSGVDNGFWVFNESYIPGWHAWVDDMPTPILRAYGLFMAVPVGKGVHRVDFRYEPSTFRLGLFLSLTALAILGGLFLQTNIARTRP